MLAEEGCLLFDKIEKNKMRVKFSSTERKDCIMELIEKVIFLSMSKTINNS